MQEVSFTWLIRREMHGDIKISSRFSFPVVYEGASCCDFVLRIDARRGERSSVSILIGLRSFGVARVEDLLTIIDKSFTGDTICAGTTFNLGILVNRVQIYSHWTVVTDLFYLC